MRIGFFLYHITKVLFGIILIVCGTYNVIKYSDFLNRLDTYFDTTTVFGFGLLEELAPLVPFGEFGIGMFLTLGIFTRKALLTSSVFFGFCSLFFLDSGYLPLALIHLFLCILAIILLRKKKYDLSSIRYDKDSYGVMQ